MKLIYLLIIIFLFLCSEIFINPLGNFPLNDDWAYSKIVFNYLENKQLSSTGWEGSLFYPQMFLGIIICKMFGFSFTGLRILVIILSITGSVVFYIIFNNLTKSVKLSSIGTFLILFNPLYIQYTNTFYPDVPYTILTFLSFYFLLNYINYHDSKNYLLGILFSIISIFIKQTGISILFAFAFTYLLFNKKTFNNIILTITPVFITSLFLIIYEFISLSVGTLPGYGAYSDMGNIIYRIILSPTLIDFKKIIYYTLNTTLVCGLFIFPLSTPVFYAIQKRIKFKNLRWFLTSLLLYSILILFKIHLRGKYIPFSSNNVYDIGLGPIILTGIQQNVIPGLSGFGEPFWLFMSIIGAVGFITMLFLYYYSIKYYFENINIQNRNHLTTIVFSTSIIIIFISPHLLVNVMARYIMSILPFLICVIISTMLILNREYSFLNHNIYRTILLLFTPLLIFGILATKDYFSFNRSKWDALKYLTLNKNISEEKIDGGFEFNEWHFSNLYTWKMTDNPIKTGRFWPIIDDEYIVTVTQIEGYHIYKEFKYKRWLPTGVHTINILKRNDR